MPVGSIPNVIVDINMDNLMSKCMHAHNLDICMYVEVVGMLIFR